MIIYKQYFINIRFADNNNRSFLNLPMSKVRSYRYLTVDVFTDKPLEGNPLAVFPDAAGIDDITM